MPHARAVAAHFDRGSEIHGRRISRPRRQLPLSAPRGEKTLLKRPSGSKAPSQPISISARNAEDQYSSETVYSSGYAQMTGANEDSQRILKHTISSRELMVVAPHAKQSDASASEQTARSQLAVAVPAAS